MNLKDFMDMMKEELHNALNEDDQGDELDDELPAFHRPLSTDGFKRLSPEETVAITQRLPVVDPDYDGWDGEKDEVCQIKRLNRDRKLSCSLELYRKMSIIDPDSVSDLKFRGKLVVDLAKVAEQENQQLAQLLATHLPAYILKRDSDEISAFEVGNVEDLHALVNNAMYETFQDFGERDVNDVAEVDFINHLVYGDSNLNIQFPSLGGHLHLCSGQVFIGSTNEEGLLKMEEVLRPLGTFAYRADEHNDDEGDN